MDKMVNLNIKWELYIMELVLHQLLQLNQEKIGLLIVINLIFNNYFIEVQLS